MAFGGDSSSYARSGCSLEKFKLTAVAWDSDKDPGGYHLWIENFGSMVRATEHGSLLEDMLDSKLGRVKVAKSVPSFLLQDPDFGLPPEDEMFEEKGEEELSAA